MHSQILIQFQSDDYKSGAPNTYKTRECGIKMFKMQLYL